MSLPIDLISFFESPKVGPKKDRRSRAKMAVRRNSLIKTLLDGVLRVFPTRITLAI
jgi:hypothetical protein